MELVEFVLDRIEEEEDAWRVLAETDQGFALAMEKGLQRCGDKRRALKAYEKKPGRRLREQLQQYALAYYDHPEYNDDWRPSTVPRWSG